MANANTFRLGTLVTALKLHVTLLLFQVSKPVWSYVNNFRLKTAKMCSRYKQCCGIVGLQYLRHLPQDLKQIILSQPPYLRQYSSHLRCIPNNFKVNLLLIFESRTQTQTMMCCSQNTLFFQLPQA